MKDIDNIIKEEINNNQDIIQIKNKYTKMELSQKLVKCGEKIINIINETNEKNYISNLKKIEILENLGNQLKKLLND